jgi:hypothetical protein
MRHCPHAPRVEIAPGGVGALAPILMVLLALPPVAAAEKGTAASPERGSADESWTVEYVVGTEAIPIYRNLELKVGPKGITGHGVGKANLSIPSRAILEIAVDEFPHRPLVDASSRIPAAEPGGGDLAVAGAFAALNVVAWTSASVDALVALGEELAALNDRYVYIVWKDHGAVRDVLLSLDRRPAGRLLAAIEGATGHRWTDLAAQRKQFLHDLEARDDTGLTIKLDRDAVLGPKLLDPGRYRLILVEGGEGSGELFVYRGRRADPDDLVSRAAVEVASGVAGSPDAEVTYVERDGATFVGAIESKGRRLQVPPNPPPWEPRLVLYGDGYALRFEAEEGWIALVSRVDRGAEPALRFPVVHPTIPVCSGFLYLTSSRIVYDPVHAGKGGHPLSLARRWVKHVGLAQKLGVDFLRIETDGDEYSFRPQYQRAGGQRASMGLKNGSRADRQVVNFFLEGMADFAGAARRLEGPAVPGLAPDAPAPP